MTSEWRPVVLLGSFTAIAVLSSRLPPIFPPYLPDVHTPMWWALAALCGGLAVLAAVAPDGHRPAKLVLGWSAVILALVQAFVVGDVVAMFATWLVVPALGLVAGRLRPRPRKALVAAHTVAAALWVGIAATFVAMAVVALTSSEPATRHTAYGIMATFDVTVLPWANFATVLTGPALSVCTTWGLFRYYWVVAKILVSIGILAMAFGFLHDRLEAAAHDLSGGATVLRGFTVAFAGLLVALLLSIYKPGGRIGSVSSDRSPATRSRRRHRSP